MNSFSSLFDKNWSDKFSKFKKVQKNKNENWDEKAIECLIKKLLKARPDTLKIFEKVLEQQSPNTPCVTVNKTQDGRVQINYRKIHPHVAFCKVWRFPDLKNQNELKQLPEYCNKSFYQKLDEVCINPYHYERVQPSLQCAESPEHLSKDNSLSDLSFSSWMNVNGQSDSMNDQMMNSTNSLSMSQSNNSQLTICNSDDNSSNRTISSPASVYYDAYSSFPNSPLNQNYQNDNFCSNNMEVYDSFIDTNHAPLRPLTFQSNSPISCYSKSTPSEWCSVVFFEYKNRLGRKVISTNQQIISGLDFPKYLLPTQGIELQRVNGEVFIECCTKVFLQSPFLNWLNKNTDLKKVTEIEPGTRVKIFDEHAFENMIRFNYQSYEALSSLIKFSKCTLSFGLNWTHPVDIFKKPCWIEISLDGALTILDEPLSILGSSNHQVTSVS